MHLCNLVIGVSQAQGDGVLTYDELRTFFKGDEKLSSYFVTNIDSYQNEREDTADGIITLEEWLVFCSMVGVVLCK